MKGNIVELVINNDRINDIRYLNKYFESINQSLQIGGIFKGNIGSFCGISSKDRVSILLAFLSSEVRVSISSLDISAA